MIPNLFLMLPLYEFLISFILSCFLVSRALSTGVPMSFTYGRIAAVARYKLHNYELVLHFVVRRTVSLPKCNLFITCITMARNVLPFSALI